MSKIFKDTIISEYKILSFMPKLLLFCVWYPGIQVKCPYILKNVLILLFLSVLTPCNWNKILKTFRVEILWVQSLSSPHNTWDRAGFQLGANHVSVILSHRRDSITSVWYYVSQRRDTSFLACVKHRKKYLWVLLSSDSCNST